MRDLVVRKLEVSLNLNILEENNEAKALFKEENKINIKDINYEKDTEINNLKNLVDDYKVELDNIELKYNKLKKKYMANNNNKIKNIFIVILNIVIIILAGIIYKYINF